MRWRDDSIRVRAQVRSNRPGRVGLDCLRQFHFARTREGFERRYSVPQLRLVAPKRFAVGLRGQFAQLRLGVFHRVALGAEGRIAQARATVFARGTVTKAATIAAIAKAPAGAARATCTATGVAATGTTRAPAIAAVAKFSTAALLGRLGALGAGAVVTAHGDHGLGGLGRGHGCGCRRLGGAFGRFILGSRRFARCFSFSSCLRRFGGRFSRF